MADLAAFQERVRHARRSVGRTQQQLARTIGLHPDVLSHKLNGHPGSLLTAADAVAIVGVLAEWGAISTTADAQAILRPMALPPRILNDEAWYAALPSANDGSGLRPLHLAEIADPLNPARPPRPVTPLIGRESVVAAVVAALQTSRLVTLTGVGGTGKTRVALAVAADLAPGFADGVAFADLAPLSEPGLIGLALVRALGLPSPNGRDTEALLADALSRAHLLLVVDNLEHLVDGSAVLGRLLQAAPELKILVTSRVPLHLYGEYQYRVPALSVPLVDADRPDRLRDSESVQLFLQRARAVRPDLDAEGSALGAVAQICSSLEGLPLSIELAAAQTRVMPPAAILERLQHRLGFLTAGARDVPDRQRSLRATLEWSAALLDDLQQRRFERFGVFAGSFDLSAASAVIGDSPDALHPTLVTLVEHNMLERRASDPEPDRFRMLETLREYALERLEERGEGDEARRSHLRYYADLAASMDTHGRGPINISDLDRLKIDDANVNAALNWVCTSDQADAASVTDGLRLATDVARLWHRRSTVPEGLTYLQRLLKAADRIGDVPLDIRSAALLRSAMLSVSVGDYAAATGYATRCLQLFERLLDRSGMSWANRYLSEAALATNDPATAYTYALAQLELARQAGDEVGETDSHNMLGQSLARLGDHQAAESELHASVRGYRQLGNLDGAASALDSVAELALGRQDIRVAAARWAEALQLDRRSGNRRGTIYHLEGCAKVMASSGKPLIALECLGATQRLRSSGGWVLPAAEGQRLRDLVDASLTSLTAAEQTAALARGRHADLEDVIELALSELVRVASTTVARPVT